ncbi:hypothetical protein FA95DRAFT_1566872 [Auriscalpium vulgare]|uniref:Uncharacterized protein n=1 Tax=Auriscalpium vulgare TaxID=40419 RepID=A0ACB8R7F6_9AGAM|nr:hypothetical protein FA95DRAFT_1566872 [Auriscalpium vulgare]
MPIHAALLNARLGLATSGGGHHWHPKVSVLARGSLPYEGALSTLQLLNQIHFTTQQTR